MFFYRNCNVCPLCVQCKSHDSYECEVLRKLPDKNFIIEHFEVIATLRFLFIRSNPQKQDLFSELLMMESHVSERKQLPIWKYVHDRIVLPLISSGLITNEDEELVQEICGILDTNRFDLRGPKFPVSGFVVQRTL